LQQFHDEAGSLRLHRGREVVGEYYQYPPTIKNLQTLHRKQFLSAPKAARVDHDTQ